MNEEILYKGVGWLLEGSTQRGTDGHVVIAREARTARKGCGCPGEDTVVPFLFPTLPNTQRREGPKGVGRRLPPALGKRRGGH